MLRLRRSHAFTRPAHGEKSRKTRPESEAPYLVYAKLLGNLAEKGTDAATFWIAFRN
jgi:hypothetical protein